MINVSMMSRYDHDHESYTEAMLKRSVSYNKERISLVPLTIFPLVVGVKAYLIYFSVLS